MSRTAIVGLGEVLWDVFPTGARFGGAPANFACHIAALGGHALMVSAVGRDDLGRRALADFAQHGVDAQHVTTNEQPTAQVLVQLDSQGHASYEFPQDTAWDHLAWSEPLERLAAQTSTVCFGTLAQRSQTSQDTIRKFVRGTPDDCLRILDVNLRTPYWNETLILESLALANVLKLNDDELTILSDMLAISGNERQRLQQILDRFSLELVALTRGVKGSVLLSKSDEYSDLPGVATTVRDTVGAGDSFTATLVMGLRKKLPLDGINAWASRVAAYVCSQSGATPPLPDALRRLTPVVD